MGHQEDLLLQELAEFSLRPLDFVYWAFPWGEEGTELVSRTGPEAWQEKVLGDLQAELLAGADYFVACGSALRDAYQAAIRSGHGVGKTTLLSWIVIWAISTREMTRGRVTANTEKQLRQILWAELAKWHRLFIGNELFVHTATAYHAISNSKEWRIDAVPWSEDNTQAFAGMHNFGKRLLMIFDEASTIVDEVWEVADGITHEGQTEIIWIVTGNPNRNIGRFKECWGKQKTFWRGYRVDSRSVSFANKERIERAIELWGEDSDFVKVRYLGEFPAASASQLISEEAILSARRRRPVSQHWEALILACDVARFGDNESVITFRRGRDARTIPPIRRRGLSTDQLGDLICSLIVAHEPDATFIDEGGVGGGVVDWVRRMGHPVVGVQFGARAGTYPGGVRVANKRAEMYVALRDWLNSGGCITDDQELHDQLIAIEYFVNKKDELILIPKEEMDFSPDWADALAISFAFAVSPKIKSRTNGKLKVDYDPLGFGAMPGEEQHRPVITSYSELLN